MLQIEMDFCVALISYKLGCPKWQKVFFEQGASAFAPEQSVHEKQQAKKIAVLEAKLTTKNEVLSELMEEHIFLKKSLGET